MQNTDRNPNFAADAAKGELPAEQDPDAIWAEQVLRRRQQLLTMLTRAVSLREVEKAVQRLRPQVQKLS